jgi:glycosyltransferase involved in cell wall biosynthesis
VTLAVIETHPVQYHAPVYRVLQRDFGVPLTAIYASDFSVVGYHDQGFGTTFAWDTDLLSGYASVFLSRVAEGGARSAVEARARGLVRALRHVNPRAVLLVGYSPRFYQMAALAAVRSRRPLLFRAETTDHAVERAPLKSLVRDTAVRWLYARCQRLLYIGQRSRQHFKRLGFPDDKLVFSPYGVDMHVFEADESARHKLRTATRQRLGIAPRRRMVLLSGKLIQRKRPDLVLRALKESPAEVRDHVDVVALGAGDQQAAFERLAAEPPVVNVKCVGFQNQTQLSAYYHAADVLVMPSQSDETWGLVVNEALHHGVPCVVSDAVGCAPDLIESGVTGEVFGSGSASCLAEALHRALPLSDSREMRERCRAKVSAYSVERAAAGIAGAYAAVH